MVIARCDPRKPLEDETLHGVAMLTYTVRREYLFIGELHILAEIVGECSQHAFVVARALLESENLRPSSTSTNLSDRQVKRDACLPGGSLRCLGR